MQAEYERYFTLKTGKPKYADLESDLAKARDALDAAGAALAEVETDSNNYERCLANIRRLEAQLPELEQEEKTHEANWQAVSKLKELVAAKRKELVTAEELAKGARDDMERREKLAKSVVEHAEGLQQRSKQY